MQVTDEDLLSAYRELKSFGAVANRFSLSRSGVHLRLTKMPDYKPVQHAALTEQQKQLVRELYIEGFTANDGKLNRLVEVTGHTKQYLCRFAASEGLTNPKRTGVKWRLPPKPPKEPKPYVHPRGMLGKKHSEEAKERMSKTRLENPTDPEIQSQRTLKGMQTKFERYGSVCPKKETPGRSWKSGWRTIGGQHKFFRSRWEANYARVLEWRVEQGIISTWQHEPETFWFLNIKRGVRSYLPDFRVTYPDGRVEYHEVKGWMDDRSKTTLSRMAKYYPQIKIVVVDKDWFKANRNFKMVLKGWE